MKEIIERIEQKITIKDLVAARVQPADAQLLLSAMYANLTERRTPSELLKRYQDSSFVVRSPIPQSKMIKIDERCFACLPDKFEDIEFSTVAPLGLNCVLSNLSQNVVMSCVRGVEIVADPTTTMALECASRRKKERKQEVHLSTSMRCLRLQPFEKDTGFTSHFRVFALGSSGRNTKETLGSFLFTHISTALEAINQMSQLVGNPVNNTVCISDISLAEHLIGKIGNRETVARHTQDPAFNLFDSASIDCPCVVSSVDTPEISTLWKDNFRAARALQQFEKTLLPRLKERHPHVEFAFDLARVAGIGYYNGLCYKIQCTDGSGQTIPIADGGSSNWVAKLLSDNKELYFSTGIGTELFYKAFGGNNL